MPSRPWVDGLTPGVVRFLATSLRNRNFVRPECRHLHHLLDVWAGGSEDRGVPAHSGRRFRSGFGAPTWSRPGRCEATAVLATVERAACCWCAAPDFASPKAVP